MDQKPSSVNIFTREFFEHDQRAALLRNICIRALHASSVALASQGRNQEALASLLDSNEALSNMDIAPGMHTIAPDDPERLSKKHQMKKDPILAMEWIAGQVRNAIIDTDAYTNAGRQESLGEHDELDGTIDDLSVVKLRTLGPKARQFVLNLGLIGMIEGFVDYDAGPSDDNQFKEQE